MTAPKWTDLFGSDPDYPLTDVDQLTAERDHARRLAVALEGQVARVEALVEEWDAIAAGSAYAAVAREGLSDATGLADHAATMTRRAAQLRAALDAPDA